MNPEHSVSKQGNGFPPKTFIRKHSPANPLSLGYWDLVADLPAELWDKFVLFKPLSL